MMLSLLLARAGVPVTLLEAHKDFDRDFRGDTIHSSTLEVLDQIGLVNRLHLVPVDLWEIDPQPNPTSRPKVSGYVKALGCEVGETLVGAGFSFAIESHAPVAVMVVEIVAEPFSANFKAQVLVTSGGDRSVGQRLDQR